MERINYQSLMLLSHSLLLERYLHLDLGLTRRPCNASCLLQSVIVDL